VTSFCVARAAHNRLGDMHPLTGDA
jgi:hypothetical protein